MVLLSTEHEASQCAGLLAGVVRLWAWVRGQPEQKDDVTPQMTLHLRRYPGVCNGPKT